MDLDAALRHIQSHLDRMRSAYLRPVFDEWAILSASGKSGSVAAYNGPRPDQFRRNVVTDAEPLRSVTAGRGFADGDIEFTSDGAGTRYDAFMKIGATSYLILNHTSRTMTEIRQDPRWLAAQAVLFELSEKFRADPLKPEDA